MPNPRKKEASKPCKTCGVMMVRKRINGRLEDMGAFNRRNHCSLSCANTRADVKTGTYRQRARNFRKDSCEKCGVTEMLHVHHIDHSPKNNAPQNLQTLCATCHLKYHWENGRRKPKKSLPCKVCGRPSRKLDMCQKHYQRFKRHGNPLLMKRGNKSSGIYFVKEVISGNQSIYLKAE